MVGVTIEYSKTRSHKRTETLVLNFFVLVQWLRVTGKMIAAKGAGGLLSFFDGSLSKALQAVYPGMTATCVKD